MQANKKAIAEGESPGQWLLKSVEPGTLAMGRQSFIQFDQNYSGSSYFEFLIHSGSAKYTDAIA